ncbi:MAG: hypothetical protein GX928_03240 [Ruminococcaceae bacterium]|nr:hypothetical protein [Oscillospiraceae bacterium]
MTKKFVSILSVILIIATIAFPVFAEDYSELTVTVNVDTGMRVEQGGSVLTPTSIDGFNRTYKLLKTGGPATLSVDYAPGIFVTINGTLSSS